MLYIRHLAWLDATPEGTKKTRRELYEGSDLVDIDPELHTLWLVEAVLECGLCYQTGFGIISISWQEIHAWQQATGFRDSWMARAVKTLSSQYVVEYKLSTDTTRPTPYQDTIDEQEQRKAVSQQFKNFLRAKS